MLRVGTHGLALTDRTGSGGSFPVSVTAAGDRVYVLNAGAPANITGFRLGLRGRLHPLPGTTRLLGDGAFGQVILAPGGRALRARPQPRCLS